MLRGGRALPGPAVFFILHALQLRPGLTYRFPTSRAQSAAPK